MAISTLLISPQMQRAATLGATATAAQVQAALTAYGTVVLEPGTHTWTTKINVGDNQAIFGFGNSTRIRWAGAGNYAMQIGSGSNGNGTHVANLRFINSSGVTTDAGGVEIKTLGLGSTISNVHVHYAAEDGFRFLATSLGESCRMHNCSGYSCAGNGLSILTADILNLLYFDACDFSSNQGYGVYIEPDGTVPGEVAATLFHQCAIQGNGRGGSVKADMAIIGNVVQTKILSCWFEPFDTVNTDAGILLNSNGAGVRKPGAVIIDDFTTFSNYYPWTTSAKCAIKSLSSQRPLIIGRVNVTPYNVTPDSGSTVRYKANTGAMRPIGVKQNVSAMSGLSDAADAVFATDWIVLDTGLS